jgi:hypothetical protein
MRAPSKHFPPGVVRECRAFDFEFGDYWRWDFAWRDPASGRIMQYNCVTYADDALPEADFAERVRAPALARIEREIHRKCGMAYALANQYPLSLPRGIPARFV